MKSNWVPVKPNYPPSSNSKELMRKINEQLDNQIEWYEMNADSNEDECIKDKLYSIKNLAKHFDGVSANTLIPFQAGNLCRADVVFLNQCVL